jgi:tryptophan-rich sensory protein
MADPTIEELQAQIATLTAQASPSPWFRNDQPFWLPPGTISALIIILVALTVCGTYLLYKWAPPELVPVLVMAVQGYQQSALRRVELQSNGVGK